tara:strand:- start:408 stop:764 length:357 start_codon:yes stop_codon:yes gene_type:complete
VDKEIERRYKAKLIRVVDGDTIDAQIDLGFDVSIKKRIRLWGINAPEKRSKDKREVRAGKEVLRRLATILALSDGEFELIDHGDGKYGRCLGEIYIKTEERSVNQMLLDEGLVKEYRK